MPFFDIRGLRRSPGGGNPIFTPIQSNERGELFVVQGLSPYVEVTRSGRRWKVMTVTPFAGIVAVPTTLAKLEIKNNHKTDPWVVDTIFAWQLLGTAVVWAITPWAQVGVAVVSGVTALAVGNGNGSKPYTTAAGTELVTAVDQSVVANGWEVFPGSSGAFGLAAATPGPAVVGQVDGRLVVPPGMSLHVAVSASVATASALHCGASGYFAANVTPE